MAQNDQIIDVDLEANSGDLLAAVDQFYAKMKQVQLLITSIGNKLNANAASFDKKTTETLQAIRRTQSQIELVERMSKQNQLSPAETIRLQKQLATQQIRDIRDRKALEMAADQARLRRVETLDRIQNESKKSTRQALLGELQLHDHIESKVQQRLRAMDRLEAQQKRLNQAWEKARQIETNMDKKTQAWIKAENEAKAREQKLDQRKKKELAAMDREASARVQAEERAGEQILANRQRRQLELDKAEDRLRKQNTLTNAERLAMAKKVADLQIRSIATREDLQKRVDAAQEFADRKTLEMQKATSAEVKRRLRDEITLAEYNANRGQRRLNAMDRQQTMLSPREQLQREKTLATETVNSLRQVGDLDRMLTASRERRTRLVGQLETEQNAKIQRELMQRIQLENHIEAKIKARIRLLQQEAAAQARANAPQKPGVIGSIMSPGYAGAALARTGVYAAAAAGIYGTVNTIRQAVGFAVELEDKLADLQAIAGATDLQMEELSLSILETARNSKFATVELVQATTVLAQAGLTAKDMETALDSVSNLALAAGTDLTTSSETLTSVIGAFQLQASEMPRIADALVGALNRSKLSIEQVAAAIQYAGATAFENNITFEELLGTAGALAQAGIRSGSTIGTGLRQFLVDLQDPSKKLIEELTKLGLTLDDVDVSSRGLVPVLQTLRDAGFDSAQAYAGLETRAAAAYLVAKNNIGTIRELMEAQYALNQATDAAEKSMDSLGAQWNRFKNLLGEDFVYSTSEAMVRFKNALKLVNDAMAEQNERMANGVSEANSFRNQLMIMNPTLGGVVYGLDMATSGLSDYSTQAEAAATEVKKQSEEFMSQMETVNAVDNAIERLLQQQGRYRGDARELQMQTLSLARQFDGLGGSLLQAAGNFDAIIAKMQEFRSKAYEAAMAAAQLQANAAFSQRLIARAEIDKAVSSGVRGRMPADVREAYDRVIGTSNLGTSGNLYANMLATSAFMDRVGKLPEGKLKTELLGLGNQFATRSSAFTVERSARQQFDDARVRASPEGAKALNTMNTMRSWTDKPKEQRPGFGNMNAVQFGETSMKTLSEQANKFPKGSPERNFFDEQILAMASLIQSAKANMAGPKAKASGNSGGAAERALRRQQRLSTRNDKRVADAALKGADLDLKAAMDILDESLDYLDFKNAAVDVYSALEGWAEARDKAIAAEVKASEMNEEQAENYRREVAREIEDRRREVSRAMANGIIKMYDNLIAEADRQFNRAMQPFEAGVQLAEGRIASFDRTYNEGRVPDYVRSEQEFQARQVGETRDRARLDALYNRMEEQRRALGDLTTAVSLVESGALAAGKGITEVSKALDEAFVEEGGITVHGARKILDLAKATKAFTEEDLNNLRLKLEEGQDAMRGMDAEAAALAESLRQVVPPDFMTGLQLAAREYVRLNNLNRGFEEQMTMGLSGAFEETHSAMTAFWETMLNNPTQAASAFEQFGNSVIGMLKRMAAEALANQLMGLLLSAVGGGFSMKSSVSSNLAAASKSMDGILAGGIGKFNGGLVRRYSGGGLVTEGVANRDSVLTALAKDEFVLRKPAVDSIGVGFLNEMNRRGAQALGDMGNTIVASPPARQEMSVYVVAPEDKPQLGPNDVVAVITKDIMKGGTTKKLIKHVAQGG